MDLLKELIDNEVRLALENIGQPGLIDEKLEHDLKYLISQKYEHANIKKMTIFAVKKGKTKFGTRIQVYGLDLDNKLVSFVVFGDVDFKIGTIGYLVSKDDNVINFSVLDYVGLTEQEVSEFLSNFKSYDAETIGEEISAHGLLTLNALNNEALMLDDNGNTIKFRFRPEIGVYPNNVNLYDYPAIPNVYALLRTFKYKGSLAVSATSLYVFHQLKPKKQTNKVDEVLEQVDIDHEEDESELSDLPVIDI